MPHSTDHAFVERYQIRAAPTEFLLHARLATLDFSNPPNYSSPTMFGLLVTLLIIDAIILSVVVLLQAGQGGGLASLGGGGTDTVLGGRQAVTILTKLTWWCGGVFMLISLVLSLVPRGASSSRLQ